jgi:DNA-binding CsgD family transcriptional regulator
MGVTIHRYIMPASGASRNESARMARVVALQLASLLGALGHDVEVSDADSGIVLAEGEPVSLAAVPVFTTMRVGDRRLRVHVRHGGAPRATAQLTPRQREIAQLVAAGLRSADIGARLGISVHTVRRHVERILASVDARTRAEAVARLGLSLGALTPNDEA